MNISYKPLIVAVFLVTAAFAGKAVLIPKANTIQVRGQLAGQQSSPAAVLVGVAEAQDAEFVGSGALTQQPTNALVASADGAIQDPGQPIGQTLSPSEEITYTVKRGDTLSGIAAHFGVSVATIMSANPSLHKKAVQIGASIIVPGSASAANPTSSLPNFNNDFVIPAQGYNYGVLDSNNGITIVNSCGTPIVAAADGIVVPDPSISNVSGGWNGGYGNFVLIEHAFGNDIYTRYAQLAQSLVSVGDYVKQGQQIGLMGESGGVSSCELTFEVVGAQNPFAK